MDGHADFTCSGNLATVNVVDKDHKFASYSVQSAENWIEDFGSGTLSSGHAVVTMDPTFASTVNTAIGYHVFLTPKGDSKGLYIANLGLGSFEVSESNGGKSGVAFDYRVVAKRKGYESLRLANMDLKSEQVKTPSGRPHGSTESRPVARRHTNSPADHRGPNISEVVSLPLTK